MPNDLIINLDKLHTTEMEFDRIKRNLEVDVEYVVKYCYDIISSDRAMFERKGKNWYITVDNCKITVNAHSYAIITAHSLRRYRREKTMNFKSTQYQRVQALFGNSNIFGDDKGGGLFRNKCYPFILQSADNNLYKPILQSAKDYFVYNKIAWWGGSITPHPLSSQLACLNHLFPLRNDKEAVLSLVTQLDDSLIDVLPITTDGDFSAYIQFEAVSSCDNLNERQTTRGSNCTSIDALVYAIDSNGDKVLIPIEWKYVESYSNEDKSLGEKGHTRKRRYSALIQNSEQLTRKDEDIYFYEPFYQLMRQTLWAEQIIANKTKEVIQANRFLHLHVIPVENSNLLSKKYPVTSKNLEDTWRGCIKDQNKYRIISPQILLAQINKTIYKDLLEYLNERYWQ